MTDVLLEGHDVGATPAHLLDLMAEMTVALDRELGLDDPPRPVADTRGYLETGWGLPWRMWHGVVWLGDRAVGFGGWSTDPVTNPEDAWLQAYVVPELRRQRIGARLVLALLDELTARWPVSKVGFKLRPDRPIGAELRELVEGGWGLSPVIVERQSRLDLTALDRPWVAEQLAARWARVGDRFRLLHFELDDYPAPDTGFDLDRYLDCMNEIETLMPLEELEMKPERFDRERLRDGAERQRKLDRTIWNCVALENGTNQVVGFSNVSFKPADPRLVQQWGTGVVRRAQGHGLGKLLKLVMLRKILDELPTARFISTSNAHSNAAMIGINTDLGFREHHLEHVYQLPLTRLRDLLAI